jgi:hypothetical protein
MIVGGHQPEYLPYFNFFCKLIYADMFVLVDHVQFVPKAFHNRNYIRSSTGKILLTVPVMTANRSRQRIRDVEIHKDIAWPRRQWKSILLNYRKAPFFDAYAGKFEAVYSRSWTWLVDLNAELISVFMESLGIKKNIAFSSELGIGGHNTDLLIEICRTVGGHAYLSGTGARRYVEEDKFVAAGLRHHILETRHPVYRQCHTGFIPNLSTLDLLFNCGPTASEIIAAARVPGSDAPFDSNDGLATSGSPAADVSHGTDGVADRPAECLRTALI